MNTLVMILSLGIALSFMVLVHELGHYFAAKRSKVIVEEFGIGYPPRFLTLWRGNGEIVIDGKSIVIPSKLQLPKELRASSLVEYETTEDKNGRHVLTGIREIEPLDPREATVGRVDRLDRGTVYTFNAIPFGGFTRMLGEEDPTYPGSLASKPKRTRIFVLAAGSGMNLLTAVIFLALALMVGRPAPADPENAVISAVSPGSPAESAGFQAGDLILRAGDSEILNITGLQSVIQEHLGEPVVLTVQRGDEMVEITVVPRKEPPEGEGAIGVALSPRTEFRRYPWYEALWLGLKEMVSLIGITFSVPILIIKGLIPAGLARPVGPVGVGQLVGDAVQYTLDTGWWFPVMQMMGALSVAIAITNLLPLPAMDGGRILFIIIEAIRGRRVDPAKEGLVHLVGMLLLVALMLFVTWQDVVNPVPGVDWSSFF